MSDSYFDALRAAGEYPRKGYGWQTEEEKRVEIQRKIDNGWTLPWVLKEAQRMKLKPTSKVKSKSKQKATA